MATLTFLLEKAVGQALKIGASALQKSVSTPDQRLSDARTEATEDASLQVVAMGGELREVIDELQNRYLEAKRERVVALGQTIVKLIADGHAKAEDFDTEAQRAAVFEVIRFSMDALAPEVIPILARLALEPVDHFFRGLCRILVDLDADEVLDLRRLVEAASGALDELSSHSSEAGSERHAVIMFEAEGSSLRVRAVRLNPTRGPVLLTGQVVASMHPAVIVLLTRNLMTDSTYGASLALSVSMVVTLKRVVLGS